MTRYYGFKQTEKTTLRLIFRRCGVRCLALVLVNTIVQSATGASAQALSPADRQVIVGTSFGAQFIKDAFQNNIGFELFQEGGEFAAHYDIKTAPAFDAGVSIRVWKRFGVGVEFSHAYKVTSASIEADVPHPFFFGFPRTASGLVGGVVRREVGLHIQAQYWHDFTDWILVRGFCGPTRFGISHDLVTEIETEEVGFPFQQVNLVDHTITKQSESGVGYHLGFDVSFYGLRRLRFLGSSTVLDRIALAFVARHSRGTSSPVELDGGRQPSFELGGLHLAGGLRVAF